MRTIGRKLKVSFPGLDIANVTAKVDTGAWRSAIHCKNVRVKEVDGKKVLAVRFLDPEHPLYNDKELIFQNYLVTTITSIFGHKQKQYVVTLDIIVHNKRYRGEFALIDRKNLSSPVLIGTRLLENRFLVDVSKKEF